MSYIRSVFYNFKLYCFFFLDKVIYERISEYYKNIGDKMWIIFIIIILIYIKIYITWLHIFILISIYFSILTIKNLILRIFFYSKSKIRQNLLMLLSISQNMKLLLNQSNKYFSRNISELLIPKMKTVYKGYKMRKGKLPALKYTFR